MARRSIEDLDRFKNDKPLMDLMYNIRTNDETITCYDNKTGNLTNIHYIPRKEEKEKKKSKSNKSKTTPTTSTTSNTT